MYLEYTSDNICKAMGLRGFKEASFLSNEYRTLRTIFMPSFHPEVCITLKETANDAPLSVTGLKTQFWGHPVTEGLVLPRTSEDASLSKHGFEILAGHFADAEVGSRFERKCLTIDGMSVESILCGNGNSMRFKEAVDYDPAIGLFATALIQAAWEHCKDPVLKNVLRYVGGFVDLKLPFLEEPPKPFVTNLMVLGAEEERQQYLNAMEVMKPKIPKQR